MLVFVWAMGVSVVGNFAFGANFDVYLVLSSKPNT